MATQEELDLHMRQLAECSTYRPVTFTWSSQESNIAPQQAELFVPPAHVVPDGPFQRVAQRVAEFAADQAKFEAPVIPVDSWEQCVRLQKLLAWAVKRERWRLAGNLRDRLDTDSVQVYREMQVWRSACNNMPVPRPILNQTPEEILADIEALKQEFYAVDVLGGEIRVTTDPIELEGVHFGRFRICLRFTQLDQGHIPMRAVPLSPNYAGDEETSHPHVQNEAVCMGDGYAAASQATLDGRLYDFFTIVDSVLKNYGEDPFVAIEDWGQTKCRDCGSYSEDCSGCSECGRSSCGECSSTCAVCSGTTLCQNCGGSCDNCGNAHCSSCQGLCKDCERNLCLECLNDEGLCSYCEESRAAAEADSEVQPDGLGEAGTDT